MQIFLKNTSGDSEKMLAPLMKESPGRLFLRYKTAFPEFDKDQGSDAALKISEFSSYLKDSKGFL